MKLEDIDLDNMAAYSIEDIEAMINSPFEDTPEAEAILAKWHFVKRLEYHGNECDCPEPCGIIAVVIDSRNIIG